MSNSKWLGTATLALAALISVTGCSSLGVSQEPIEATTKIKQVTSSPEPISTPVSTPSTSPTPSPIPEPQKPVRAVSISKEPNQSNAADSLKAVPLERQKATKFLDIRGVGDSAMALTHRQPLGLKQAVSPGALANFGQRLDKFDPSGRSYRGDLSFLNWETTVGLKCKQFWAPLGSQSFAFMSHPDNLVEAYKRGFNLIGLANNHTRDCPSAEEGVDGAFASARHMTKLSQKTKAQWMWHGVGKHKRAQVRTMTIKGRPVKVAFASFYMAGGDCTYVTCMKDETTVLRSLRDADADIRILAIHSWTDQTQQQLVNLGVKFIKYFNGDVVFGHGPHVWKPVRVVQSQTGKRGVLFESLGNFIHPSLVPNSENIIGRALFDLDTLKLRQVQIIPMSVHRVSASFSGAPNPKALSANLSWQSVNDANWRSGVSSQVKAAYSNIKR